MSTSSQNTDRQTSQAGAGERIDPTRAVAGVERWRRALADTCGDYPGAVLEEPRRMLALLRVFGATRRLADLCLKYPSFAAKALIEGPSAVLAEAACDLSALAGGVGGPEALYGALSPIKQRADLAIGLGEISGEWTSGEASSARADLAERLVESALSWLMRGAANRGELPIDFDEHAGSAIFALAGGDFAHEDLAPYGPLDLLIIYDPSAFEGQSIRLAERAFVRLCAELREAFEGKPGEYPIFSLRTPMGNCVNGAGLVEPRTRVTQAFANTQMNALKRWLATARVVAGNRTAGGQFLEEIEETVWADAASLGEHARKELTAATNDPRASFRSAANILRWSFGRTRPVFRISPDRDVIDAAANAGVIPEDVARRLIAGCEFAHGYVGRAQMMKGATAFGPAAADEEGALAALCGFDSAETLQKVVAGHVADGQAMLTRLLEGPKHDFGRFRQTAASAGDIDKLEDLGFSNGHNLSQLLDSWSALAQASSADRFAAIAPGLITAFGETQHPDEAVRLFDALLNTTAVTEQDVRDLAADGKRRDLVVDAFGSFGAAVKPLLEAEDTRAILLGPVGSETPQSGAEFLSRFAPPRDADIDAIAAWRRRAIARTAFFAVSGEMDFAAAADALACVQAETLKRLFVAVASGAPDCRISLHQFESAGVGLPGFATPIGFVAEDGDPEKCENVVRDFLSAIGRLGEGVFAVTPNVSHRPGGVAGSLAPDPKAMRGYIQSEAIATDQILLARARMLVGEDGEAAKALRSAVSNPRRAEILFRDLDRARAQKLRRDRAQSLWDLDNVEGGLYDTELIISSLIYRAAAAQPSLQSLPVNDALDLLSRAGVTPAEVADTLKAARAFWLRLTTLRALARWSDPQREPVRKRFATLIARAAEVDSYQAVRPIMRGYADEVSRLYAQLVLGRPALSLVANG